MSMTIRILLSISVLVLALGAWAQHTQNQALASAAQGASR